MELCPRCHTGLTPFAYPSRVGLERGATVPVQRCDRCSGVSVEVRHNVPFLDAVARDLAAHVDLLADIAAHPGPQGVCACPPCQRPMTRFGYLGTQKVFLDRCEACLVLWHDGSELFTTVALHARTTGRREQRQRDRDEATRGLNAVTSAVLRGVIRS